MKSASNANASCSRSQPEAILDHRSEGRARPWLLLIALALTLSLARSAAAQSPPPPGCVPPVFSIDSQSPTMGTPNFVSVCAPPFVITEGDLLSNFLQPCPVGPPFIQYCRDQIGLTVSAGCAPGPGSGCGVEVDALAVGNDELPPGRRGCFKFSVSRDSRGFQVGAGVRPSVFSEGASGAGEAGSDVFVDLGIGVLTSAPPLAPATPPVGNVGAFDGDGCRSSSGSAYPGLGLAEIGAPADELDALEMDQIDLCGCGVFFSLSASSASAQSPFPGIGTLVGGDILLAYSSPCTGSSNTVLRVHSAASLGLDLFGPNTDDVDALALTELSGPSCGAPPFPGVPILFSVARGSAVLGLPDSRYGVPIEPDDILEPPLAPTVPPRIYIPAEVLGLKTMRTHGFADDLDGLVVTSLLLCDCDGNAQEDAVDIALGASDCERNGVIDSCEFTDCNGNAVHDACDIATGTSPDVDGNGTPDECDPLPGLSYCFGDGVSSPPTTPCPCANFGAPGNGCASSFNPSGAHLTASGFISLDNVVLSGTGMQATGICVFLKGSAVDPNGFVFGDGVSCTGGTLIRLRAVALGGIASGAQFPVPPETITLSARGNNTVGSGQLASYTVYYRNAAAAFCPPFTFNCSNHWEITW